MSNATDRSPPPTAGPGATDYDRYAAVSLDGEGCIVYDRDREDAWLQATRAVPLDEWR